jgi:uncharacterized membrane protein YfcA
MKYTTGLPARRTEKPPDLFSAILLFVAYRTARKANGNSGAADPVANPDLPCIRDAGSSRFVWTASCARALAMSDSAAGLPAGLLGVGVDLSWCRHCNGIPT